MKNSIYWGITGAGAVMLIISGIRNSTVRGDETLTEIQKNQKLLMNGTLASTGFLLLAIGAAFLTLRSKMS